MTRFCNGVNASTSISCGICNCKEGRSGQACQCYVTESGETEQGNNEKCINPVGNQGILCSNRLLYFSISRIQTEIKSNRFCLNKYIRKILFFVL